MAQGSCGPSSLSPALRQRVLSELHRLTKKLHKQLAHDINRIYSESLLFDLELTVRDVRIRGNRALLLARAPTFLSEILDASQPALDRLNPRLIESFVRQVYNQNVIKHKEDAVVEELRKAKGKKRGRVEGSPDSDVFLTPRESPGEAPLDTRRCAASASLYYNLVHLERDSDSPRSVPSPADLLRRELAEQDLLFHSFHSIIIKEGRRNDNKASPHSPPRRHSLKKKKVAVVKPVAKVLQSKLLKEASKNEYIDCGFDSEHLTLEADYKKRGMESVGRESRRSSCGSSPSVTWDSVMQDPPSTRCVEIPPCPTEQTFTRDTSLPDAESKTDPLRAVKTNYFIDAADLTDEAEGAETDNLSVAYITESAVDFDESECLAKDTLSVSPTKPLDNIGIRDTPTVDKDCQNNISIEDASEPILLNGDCCDAVVLDNVNDLGTASNLNREIYIKTEPMKCMNINALRTADVGVQNDSSRLFLPLSESRHAQTDDEANHSPDSLGDASSNPPVSDKATLVSDFVQTEPVSLEWDQGCYPSVGTVTEHVLRATPLAEVIDVVTHVIDPVISTRDDSIVTLDSILPVTDSPRVRRKTEEAPILSGAATFTPLVEEKPFKPKSTDRLTTSWTIDMSDSTGSERNAPEPERTVRSGFGFFVPLSDNPSRGSDPDSTSLKKKEGRRSIDREDAPDSSRGSSCGFDIDMKNEIDSSDPQIGTTLGDTDLAKPEKKLFSMFIDIGDSCSKSSDSASPKSKTGSPFLPTRKPRVKSRCGSVREDPPTSLSSDSGLDMGVGEHPEVVRGKSLFGSPAPATDASTSSSSDASKKQSFYMFIEADPSKPRSGRKSTPLGLSQSSNSRLSWNRRNGRGPTETPGSSENDPGYKRTQSLNERSDRSDCGVSGDGGTSGPASVDTALLSQTPTTSARMMSSWHGVVKPSNELSKIINSSKSRDCSLKDNLSNSGSEKCHTEDMSSSFKSDDIFEWNASVSSKEGNRTFVLDDVSKLARADTAELEASTSSGHDIISDLSKDDSETDKIQEASVLSDGTQKSEKLCAAPPPTDTVGTRGKKIVDDDGYVKLSDMDRIVPTRTKDRENNSRMTRSIPEGSSLFDNKILTKSCTSRSLSRLFPHLSSQFLAEPDDVPSNNSMQSSLDPSLEASAEGIAGECSRLGEDLLRMFVEEISPDVVVEVGGRRIKAHKCILSSRCQYFAAMLSGGWVESAGNLISLPGFSYNTVHFALCHIYSGANNVPDSINIVELATLADMLCLEGLKEVITYTLKVKYCHFFHKPCSDCIVGCVECLPVAAAYGLDEIYRKSLRWICKHFTRVWPTKSFASLPKELHDKCYKQHIVHMNAENVVETMMGCEKVEATLPNVRWSQTVSSLNWKLQDASLKYLTNHFNQVLSTNSFLSLSREDAWTVGRLEEVLTRCVDTLRPEQAVLSFSKLHSMLAAITPHTDYKTEFVEVVRKLEERVEQCLVKQAGRAARTPAWSRLDPALRNRIEETACLVFTPGHANRNHVLSSQQRSLSKTELAGVATSLERQKRPALSKSRPVSSKSAPPPNKGKCEAVSARGGVVRGSNTVGSRLATPKTATHTRVTAPKAVTPRVSAPKAAIPRVAAPRTAPLTVSARSQTNTSSSATPSPLLKSKNSRYAQVKSRYLNPKPERREEGTERREVGRGSSSDSSRTGSPACLRHPHAISTDSLEAPPSTRVSSAAPPTLRHARPLTQPLRPRSRPAPSVALRSSTFTRPSAK